MILLDFLSINFWVLVGLLALMAFLYASVGHGGASGYLAVLAIFGLAPALMKQTSLVLNLGVSLLTFIQFYRKGYFKFSLFWPFAMASIPMSYLGAQFTLSDQNYKRILGACLIVAIVRMLANFNSTGTLPKFKFNVIFGLIVGALIGLISGMIGIGGGILLSPILLLFRWTNLKEAAAISALFIFVNSLAGLLGLKSWIPFTDLSIYFWIGGSLIAGFLGARWGAFFASNQFVKYVLAGVLMIASLKLWFV